MGQPTRTNPYRIKAAANGHPAEILIYGDIGYSWYEESVEAAQFVRDLFALDASQIVVRINSYGGSVVDGIAVCNALTRHPATIDIKIDGVAASIASLIAMAGDSIEIADNAQFMLHAPWSHIYGNAAQLRQHADMLDGWAESMAATYARRTGKSTEEVQADWLADGRDHWLTAEEAVAAGLADRVVASGAAHPDDSAAAAMAGLARFRPPAALLARWAPHHPNPAAAAATPQQEQSMPDPTPPAAPQPSADDIKAQALAADKARRDGIRASFAKFGHIEGVVTLQATCEDDHSCTPQAAGEKLLALLAKDAKPVNAVVVEDERDKLRGAATQALLARAGISDEKGQTVRADSANPFRGHTLLDLARAALVRAGIRTDGMDKMALVAAAFTQSGSDFPVLLENTMHKALQTGYALAPDTWSRFCKRGSVSDFRSHKRYRLGSLGNLDALNELGEFRSKAIPDGERSSIAIGTKGNLINISRQAIINDDLGVFVGLAELLGRSARRSIEADVYALLASNPVLEDGIPLFHADHGNLGVSSAPTVQSFEEARVLMAKQMDISRNDYLDLRPAIWLGGMGHGGDVRVLNDAQYDPDTVNKLQKPNKVRGLVGDVIDTPRIAGSEWYLFASPADAPVLEVAFLDGQDTPFLDMERGFEVDGARYKVRLDYGVAAGDYRGAIKNNGA
ncbi:Clp protease ClpP [Chitiniphilus purpureus]|uniref:ATP-dependent Clp protease proteolytic subunit n=1 Tax=Chitiniphilus purpureus TaxID=2981137 RepID=A0ABY6DHN2_9NEIS|nr:ClpP-like prohead protease/major capsid protein fusion protein [Chitiniphilus sp. CD1]UXY13860.1 Clp protease ClpP [Chitiniphilus sp. CD1]